MRSHPVPHIAQVEETGCGAAALTSVLQWFGRPVTLPQLSAACDVGRDGVAMATLVAVAAAHGVRATGLRAAVDERGVRAICAIDGPVIALLRGGHFVVVDGLDRRDRVLVCDPATGRSLTSVENFVGRFSGVVLRFESVPADASSAAGTGRPGPAAAGPATAGSTTGPTPPVVLRPRRRPLRERVLLRWWLEESTAVRLLLASAAAATVLGAGCTIAGALLVRHWFDPSARWWSAVAAVVAVVSGVGARLLTAQALEAASRRRTGDVVGALLTRRPDYFHRRFAAELAGRPQRIDSAVIAMTGLFADTLVQIVTVTGLICAAVILSPVAAAVLVAAGLLGAALVVIGRRSDTALAEAELAAGSRRDSEVIVGLTSLETVKAEASGDLLVTRWRAAADLQRSTRLRMTARAQLRGRSAAFVDGAALIAALLISASLAPTALLAVLVIGSVLQQRVGALARSSVDLHAVSAALRLADDIATAPAIDPGTHPAPTDPAYTLPAPTVSAPSRSALGPTVVLSDVDYGHQRFRPPVLRGVDLHVPAGGWAFVVGASGCGKSTLAGLISGAAAPWNGQVLIDGRTPDVGDGRVCTVPQRPVVLDGTIADTLTLGAEGLADDILWDALRLVELDVVVRRRGGLRAEVHESGRNFSGGERQRLALARALVRTPSLLVLDEATSNLEPALEERIVRRLRSLPNTVVMIAHRLPELCDTDLLLRLPDAAATARTRTAAAAVSAPRGRDVA